MSLPQSSRSLSPSLPESQKVTVLVTGGSGLVGHAIRSIVSGRTGQPSSNRQYVFLSRQDGDLRNYDEAKAIFAYHRPEEVIHLAARVGGLYENQARQADFLTDNLAIDSNVLKLAHEFSVRKLIACLSTCIFPENVDFVSEENMEHGPPHPSNFGYAYAKRTLYALSKAYRDQYGCNFTLVIPTNLYGPHDNFSLGCHVIPALIKNFVAAKDAGAPNITIPGTGKALRQFVFAPDLARFMLVALDKYDSSDPVIVANDKRNEVSIAQTVEMIRRIVGFEGEVQWDSKQTDGKLRKTANNRRMRSIVNTFEFTSLEYGLRRSVEWYIANRTTGKL